MKSKHGIELIEQIHYYLCYIQHNHMDEEDINVFIRQRNIVYHTSRISRKISETIQYWSTDLRDVVYFTSYILYIKFFLDICLFRVVGLAAKFNIFFPKPFVFYEMKCLCRLELDFSFLYKKPLSYRI